MKDTLRKRIEELTAIVGIGGYEWDVAKYIMKALDGYVDSIELRPNGSVIACKKGKKPGPRFMVTGHMDEVGFEVKTIAANGFLLFDKVGKPTEGCMPGRRVLVKGRKGTVPGVIGVRAGHMLTPEQMAKPQTVGQSYVDIGAASAAEANEWGIFTGAQIVPDSPLTSLHNPDLVVSRAIDCRALCAIMVEMLRQTPAEEIAGELCAVFNVMEESTLGAIPAAVSYLEPEYGVFLDTIPCGDVPDCAFAKELPISLEKGPVLVLSQQLPSGRMRAVNHPALNEAMHKAAEKAGVPMQEFAFNGGGFATDAVAAAAAGKGIATVTLALPRRYSHSPVELLSMKTAVETQKLLTAFIGDGVNLIEWGKC